MTIVLNVIFLLIGFVLLIKGADFFVDGASSLAKKLRVPPLVVGLTIVAIGTSAPELAVSVTSSLEGANALAVSNVVGSNIFNVLVVLGLCAAVKPLGVKTEVLKRDYPIVIGLSALLLGFVIFTNGINRIEAGVLLAILAGYIILTVSGALKSRKTTSADDEPKQPFKVWKVIVFMIGGAAAIVLGGDWVVTTASALGTAFGMSETMVGLTICAVGTSLPELVTSIIATKKGETEMAIGNVVGSNIFNIVLILGISGVISPIALDPAVHINSIIDGCVVLGVVVLGYCFSFSGRKVSRPEGIIMTTLYAGYMVYAVLRDTLPV